MTETELLQTDFPNLVLYARGKVRDIYDFGDRLLLVATDRISAFDVVLPTGIPEKGKVLTALSTHWFKLMADLVPTYVVTTEVEEYPERFLADWQRLQETLAVETKATRKTSLARRSHTMEGSDACRRGIQSSPLPVSPVLALQQ